MTEARQNLITRLRIEAAPGPLQELLLKAAEEISRLDADITAIQAVVNISQRVNPIR